MSPRRAEVRPRPLRRVLVTTDFSPGARRALRRAAVLPLARGARFDLVHVLPPPDRFVPKLDAAFVADTRRQLDHERERLEVALRRARARAQVVPAIGRGPAAGTVAELARKGSCELVVVGRHGGGVIRGLLLGSVADRIVRQSPVPVLVVGQGPLRPYRRVLAALDLQPAATRALATALRLADGREARVHVVHVVQALMPFALRRAGASADEVGEYFERVRARAETGVRKAIAGLGPAAGSCEMILCRGEARAAIETEIRRTRADLAVVGTRGLRGVKRALLGSVAESVLRTSRCDVLVAGPGRRAG